MILCGIFILNFIPLSKTGQPASAKPEEDWTEIPPAQLVSSRDPSDLDAGMRIFQNKCALCHGKLGEGGAGPNLTDNYWKHGGDVSNLYNVITKGVATTSMTPWETSVTPKERLQLASFILSLQGTNPQGAKEPEGEAWLTGGSNQDSEKSPAPMN